MNNPTVQRRKVHFHDYWTHIDHSHPLKPLYPKHEFLLQSELKMVNFCALTVVKIHDTDREVLMGGNASYRSSNHEKELCFAGL